MTKSTGIAALAAALIAAPAAKAADATDARESLLEARLPRHPAFTGYAALGFGGSSNGDYSGTGFTGAVRLDSNAIAPVWLSVKARAIPGSTSYAFHGDAIAGVVLSQDRREGIATWSEKIGEDARYEYYQAHGVNAVIRSVWTVAAGVKLFQADQPANTQDVGSQKGQFNVLAGVQHHTATDHANHDTFELLAAWNPSSGSFGGVLDFHMGVPILGRLLAGCQAGLLPVDYGDSLGGHRAFVVSFEIGYAFGN